ncbi:fibronectin type III domain-containing protein [Staphylococcus sp. GDX8P107P-1]|uniref:fibronectin type III domain-containing protein n=1 Tax=Staphylococcus sp. GDX8P107P-1 TaxID=2804109 RepID=UPI001AEBBBB8|nr:fibronectin type III domain-containing protein [Staphylococcus sp. GDX8P107P-1]
MTEKLQVLDQQGNVVGESVRNEDGSSKVTINDLKPNTIYEKGTFKVTHVNEDGTSELVDVPEFKTKASRKKAKAQ